MLKIDGFDRALLGEASVWQRSGEGAERIDTLIYSGDMLVHILVSQGSSHEEAMDYITFNIENAYMGPATPIIVWARLPEEF